ncbi:MAG: hypothetical protein ABI416_11260 [Ginsengibacter sp.]
MKNEKSTYFRSLVFIIVIFVSCNNPLQRTYRPSTYEDDIQAIRKTSKVPEEDLQTMAKYIMLARLSGKDITGKSYGEIIDKIKSLQQNNTDRNNRNAMEMETKRKRLSPFLDVILQNKTYVSKNNKNILIFTIAFKNTGIKKIKTVAGNLAIRDLMEKPIRNVAIFLDEDVAPGQTLIKTYSSDYNDADENDRRMRAKDLFDMRTAWNPEKIIFENGKLIE